MSATVGRPMSGRMRAGLVVGGPLVVLAAGGYWAWTARSHAVAVADPKPAQWGTVMPLLPPRAAPAPTAVAPPPAPVAAPIAPPAPTVKPVHAMKVWIDKEALADVQSASIERHAARHQQQGPGGDGATRSAPSNVPGIPGAPPSEYAQRMQVTEFGMITPQPPRMPPAYTIKKGERLQCLPDQPLSSEMVGPIRCTLTQAVWSMDGNNVLLPVGTEINGTIEHGLGGGSQRLFPIWTDMLTPRPHQRAIPLGAPSADEMGQPGLPGDIKTHFWLKARDLALVSVIQMGGSAATAAATGGNNNNTLNIGQPISAGASLAERAFGNEVSVPDTFYRGPGQPIVIVTNKPIDLEYYYVNRVLP